MASKTKLHSSNVYDEEKEKSSTMERRRSSIGAGLAQISRRMSSGLLFTFKKSDRLF